LKSKILAIIDYEFNITSKVSETVSSWTLQFLEKKQLIRAVGEFDIRFVIFSPRPQDFIYWGL
jgi:hypothetical protein